MMCATENQLVLAFVGISVQMLIVLIAVHRLCDKGVKP